MFQGILPIGSVVSLRDVGAKIVVIGYMPVSLDDEEDEHEYSGLAYPIGYERDDKIVQFDSSEITYIHYLGLQDAEQMDFEQALIQENLGGDNVDFGSDADEGEDY